VGTDGLERRLVALLSADAVGYSRLMAADEMQTVRTLTEYRGEMARLAGVHHGRVVGAPGDNVLAEFPSALDAMRCAVDIQSVLEGRNRALAPELRMLFRIGVHLGDVMSEGDEIYGDGVNIAARLEGRADPGGVCFSGTVHELVRGKLDAMIDDLGEHTFKNIPYQVRVYRIAGSASAVPQTAGGGVARAELQRLAGRPDIAIFVVPAAWVLYVAIVLEILFMISPFGLYYYSAYGPSLNLFHHFAATSWLTAFFLPHFSETTIPLLNAVPAIGFWLIAAGLTLFVAGFAQIYAAKMRGRAVVTGGLYALTRHPQYIALAILGFGTLLVWPRFLVLVMYVTMLFLYALLGRWEEAQCLAQHGEHYRSYQRRTGPLAGLGNWLPALLPRTGGARLVAGVGLYALAIVATVAVALRMQDWSLRHVSALYYDHTAALSPALLGEEEMKAAVVTATSSPEVHAQIDAGSRGAPLLVHVVPTEWELPDLPISPPDQLHGGHHTPEFDRRSYKVLFSRARTHRPGDRGADIVKHAYGLDPIVVVKVDTGTREITGVEVPPRAVQWGDIPTPLF
jgi:class 3 adenylate cyclase/protein-S-isoprenylcysteine O-methyltransferase Ste14